MLVDSCCHHARDSLPTCPVEGKLFNKNSSLIVSFCVTVFTDIIHTPKLDVVLEENEHGLVWVMFTVGACMLKGFRCNERTLHVAYLCGGVGVHSEYVFFTTTIALSAIVR
jgi:hypothetical protein